MQAAIVVLCCSCLAFGMPVDELNGYEITKMNKNVQQTVLLADGTFPCHAVALRVLLEARRVVCCDGAADKLLQFGMEPTIIVGDGDSISDALRVRFADRLALDFGQDDNDLAKAMRYCLKQGWLDLTVLGATGRREDHTLGNLSLLVDYAHDAQVQMLTDHGVFTPLLASGRLATFSGQSVSIFAFDPATAITSQGLLYPLDGLKLTRWWQATLNVAAGDSIWLDFSGGPLLVYRVYSGSDAVNDQVFF